MKFRGYKYAYITEFSKQINLSFINSSWSILFDMASYRCILKSNHDTAWTFFEIYARGRRNTYVMHTIISVINDSERGIWG